MLQVSGARSPVDYPSPESPQGGAPAEVVKALLRVVRRQLVVIAVVFLSAIVLGVTYVSVTPPSFTAEALLMLDRGRVQLFTQQPLIGEGPIDSLAVEGEIQILKSENIALAVVRDLHLTEDPEFVGPSNSPISGFADFILSFLHLGTIATSSNSNVSASELERRALNAFASRLNPSRVGMSFVIAVDFRSRSAQRAAQIANAIVDAFINDQIDSKSESSRRASAWLQDRLAELREQGLAADRAVTDFKEKNNIVTTGGGALINDQRLSDLNARVGDARSQTAAAQARFDRIAAVLRLSASDGSVPNAAVSDALSDPIVTQLRIKYLDLVNRVADWTVRYGSDHRAVVNLRQQVKDTRTSILDELQRISETAKSDLEIARQRQQSVEGELAATVSVSRLTPQTAFRQLESSAQTNRTLYENFQQRYLESLQQQSLTVAEARVISRAFPPSSKSQPKTFLVLAISIVGGLGCGLGLGFLRDMLDGVFRTTSQVSTALQTECVTIVPAVKVNARNLIAVDDKKYIDAVDKEFEPWRPDSRAISRNSNVLWTVDNSPLSHFAESIRSIKLMVDLRRDLGPNKVIGFTSSLPNEGKSTIAASLALHMAQVGARVILVDVDLRNPSLSNSLTPNAKSGFLDVISGKCSLEEAVWTVPETRLTFLPTVKYTRLTQSTEVLASKATKQLFDKLRGSYDYVIVDLSPLAPVVDVRATTHLIDSYFFVVEWGRTSPAMAQHALNSASGVHERMIGVILNKVDTDALAHYESSHGELYSKQYDTRYGFSD